MVSSGGTRTHQKRREKSLPLAAYFLLSLGDLWPPLPKLLTLTIAALFIIARTLRQPRCQLADEWIRKLSYMYIVEYYPAIKN